MNHPTILLIIQLKKPNTTKIQIPTSIHHITFNILIPVSAYGSNAGSSPVADLNAPHQSTLTHTKVYPPGKLYKLGSHCFEHAVTPPFSIKQLSTQLSFQSLSTQLEQLPSFSS